MEVATTEKWTKEYEEAIWQWINRGTEEDKRKSFDEMLESPESVPLDFAEKMWRHCFDVDHKNPDNRLVRNVCLFREYHAKVAKIWEKVRRLAREGK